MIYKCTYISKRQNDFTLSQGTYFHEKPLRKFRNLQ